MNIQEILGHPIIEKLLERKLLWRSDVYFAWMLLQKSGSPKLENYMFLAYIFSQFREGHLCITIDPSELNKHFLEYDAENVSMILAGKNTLPRNLIEEISSLKSVPTKALCLYQGKIYLQKHWMYESMILRFLYSVTQTTFPENKSHEDLLKEPCLLEGQQKQALISVFKRPFTIVCGGPGTGKSYLAAHIVALLAQVFSKDKGSIAITAPTGKAVSHLESKIFSQISEKTELCFHARTIHSLLGISPSQETPACLKKLSYDLIIVDEASMIDAKLFALLFSAMPKNSRLVLLGDHYQLPPIEVGSVFKDIVSLFEKSPFVFILEKNFRFAQNSIVSFSRAIASQKIEEFLEGNNDSVVFSPIENYRSIYDLIPSLQPFLLKPSWKKPRASELEKFLGMFAVLSPLRYGPFSVHALNEALYAYILSLAQPHMWVTLPVMITQNQPRQNLYNGMMGFYSFQYLDKLRKSSEIFWLWHNQKMIAMDPLLIRHYEKAFALSIHKSQGSEYENALIVIPPGSELFGQELLYTAATRAKSSLQIIASKETLQNLSAKKIQRSSGLAYKWQEIKRSRLFS
ncbi:MAG: exodeoxyribonuclease V subunit alpha [Parachlamydiales bacterium]|nr:exodeoxyribonuclease V subunit alpha [Parachlamydiales bacterium]